MVLVREVEASGTVLLLPQREALKVFQGSGSVLVFSCKSSIQRAEKNLLLDHQ